MVRRCCERGLCGLHVAERPLWVMRRRFGCVIRVHCVGSEAFTTDRRVAAGLVKSISSGLTGCFDNC